MDKQELKPFERVIVLSENLKAIQRIDPQYPKSLEKELYEKYGMVLLEVLPPHVGTLNLTEDITISRPDEELKFIPIGKRETWNLNRVDQFGEQTARANGEVWTPVFPFRKQISS